MDPEQVKFIDFFQQTDVFNRGITVTIADGKVFGERAGKIVETPWLDEGHGHRDDRYRRMKWALLEQLGFKNEE